MTNPNIDFHILSATTAREAQTYACGLIEKAYAAEQRVYVQTATKEDAERLDTLLWTYNDISFLPHSIDGEAPICIGFVTKPMQAYDVFINLSQTMPNFYDKFKQVIEIVFSDPQAQQLARERYKQYRDAGHTLHTHKISLVAPSN